MQDKIFEKPFNKDEIKEILIQKFFPEDFKPENQKIDTRSLSLQKIKEVEFLGQSDSIPVSFFAIKHTGINDPRITITREAFKIIKNLDFYSPNNIVLFYTENSENWRISLITFTIEKKTEKKTQEILSNPKRFSYFLGPGAKVNTPTKNIILKGKIKDENDLKERFSVEVVTKEFYQKIANWYFWALKHCQFPKDAEEMQNGRNIALIRLITRLIFIWFMKQKKLINPDLFNKEKVSSYLKDISDNSDSYYKAILQNLFFATLNTPIKERNFRTEHRYKGINDDYMDHHVYRYNDLFKNPQDMLSIFKDIPFLNGGLFECLDKRKDDETNYTGREIRIDGFSDVKSKQPKVPNFLFFSDEIETEELNEDFNTKNKKYKVEGIIKILETYNFTIDENTPYDTEISLDPELLGRIFENLLASYNPETAETAREATGSYYTPREIVDYMVSESLKEYFRSNLGNTNNLEEKLEKLFSYENDENPFDNEETDKLINAIDNLKVIDPAVGSGAFPMGMLNKLVFILSKLDPHNKKWKQRQIDAVEQNIPDPKIKNEMIEHIEKNFQNNELNYGRKLYLIQKCLYGVDIQPIAIEIARLRFFISLLVDEKVNNNKDDNFGIEPLPNLETKLISANTLIALKKDENELPMPEIIKLEKELFEIRAKYFFESRRAKKEILKKKDREKRQELLKAFKEQGCYHKYVEQIAAWDPYTHGVSADWFDPEWMFGVKDGFDIVIGNPPYGNLLDDKSKKIIKNSYKFSTVSEIASPFIEKGINLLKDNGNLLYIITYAITFSKDFSGNRNLINNTFRETYIYSFDRDKCRIFESMSQSVSIIKCFNKNSKHKLGIFTSRMFRETPDINKIEVTNCNNYLMPKGSTYNQEHRLPKIGEKLNRQILDKLFSFNSKVEDIIDGKSKIWIRTSGNYWYNAFDRKPYTGFAISSLTVNANFSDFLIILINSSIFYFWFRIYGDGHNMNCDILENFPLPEEKVILKYNKLLNKIRIHFMNKLFSVFDKEHNRFLTSQIKSEIDLIDLVLGKYIYSLDYEEINHIINYDYQVRGGNKLPDNFNNLINQIIAAKKQHKTADTSHYEKQIDELVYKLYNLTNDEIKIIEK